MKKSILNQLANRMRRIASRLDRSQIISERDQPVFSAAGMRYEVAERVRGIAAGGIGGMQLVAECAGLAENIDRSVHVLKRHLTYHESDHVLNIAYNLLAGGTCLEHIELRRNDEVYLDAMGVQSIPDPTTTGECKQGMDISDNGKWGYHPLLVSLANTGESNLAYMLIASLAGTLKIWSA